MRRAGWLLFTVAPFATLEPLAYLSETGEYAKTFDWFSLGLALTIMLFSHRRQRKSFYYAGLIIPTLPPTSPWRRGFPGAEPGTRTQLFPDEMPKSH